jgi:diguanylate cyclase (GGDEF)-like protein
MTLRDITEMKRMSETINYQASHDSLTGLSNREEFSFKLNEILVALKTSSDRHALVVIDIDRFKVINDTCGAMAGDELLRQIAAHVQSNISRKDISARIGGDEFAIILKDCEPDDSVNVAKRLKDAVEAKKFTWQTSAFPVTLSIGIVPLSQESDSIHAVLASADDACHLSKEEGGNRVSVFHAKDTKFLKRRGEMEWISKINRAAEENRFVLYQQTIAPLKDSFDSRPKAEVLIRLVNEDGSIARPGDFIPAAERYNLMPLIDRWVIKNAMASYKTLSDRGSPLKSSLISINLSGPSFLDEAQRPRALELLLRDHRDRRDPELRGRDALHQAAEGRGLHVRPRRLRRRILLVLLPEEPAGRLPEDRRIARPDDRRVPRELHDGRVDQLDRPRHGHQDDSRVREEPGDQEEARGDGRRLRPGISHSRAGAARLIRLRRALGEGAR